MGLVALGPRTRSVSRQLCAFPVLLPPPSCGAQLIPGPLTPHLISALLLGGGPLDIRVLSPQVERVTH